MRAMYRYLRVKSRVRPTADIDDVIGFSLELERKKSDDSMSSDEVHILFTMDVEPVSTGEGVSGPESEEAGLNATRAYREILSRRGYLPSYFVHPELARSYPSFFSELAESGCALGLHLHSTKFAGGLRMGAHDSVELGGLTAAEQRKVVGEAASLYESALGYRPTLFRPGCFSANDFTYSVLHGLGFTGGSISIPGRIWPERFCVWSGAYPYAHYAHPSFRQVVGPGELPFVDIPLSVDLTSPLKNHPVGFLHYPDLRPGGVYSEDDEMEYDRRSMLKNILRQMKEDDPPVKTLVVDVHNDRDFIGRDSQAARHLHEVLEGIEPECRAIGYTPVASTYDKVVASFLQE